MFIIQGLLNTPSLVLYGSKNRLKTCERFALLNPRILMRGARLTALLPFYRMRRLRTHNHLVCKWTLNRLAKLAKNFKWLSCLVSTYLYCAFASLAEWLSVLLSLQPINLKKKNMTYWKNLAISKISKNDINIIKTKYEIMKLIVAAN